jgi:hypothetical protein
MRVKHHHEHNHPHHDSNPAYANSPPDAWPSQAVQDIEPNGKQRSDDVRPVGDGTSVGVLDLKTLNAHQDHARNQQHQRNPKEPVAPPYCAAVGTVVRVADVDGAEHRERQQ